MKKFLLFAAAAMVAVSSSAETKVLWTAEDSAAGVLATWDAPLLSLSADDIADLKAGDVFTMTVTGIDEGNGWPQVAIFNGGEGWPPVANAGVGGKEYPYVAEIHISPVELAALINGVDFKGDGAYVSEIALIKSDKVFDPNTVWFGPKVCNWGDPVNISSEVFVDVKAGDKLVVEYNKEAAEHTLQFLFGGWSGPNFPTYQSGDIPFMTIDEEAGTITLEFSDDFTAYTWEEKTSDLFALLKEGGLFMQGPCTVEAVLYIKAGNDDNTGVSAIVNENVASVYYNLQGQKVVNPVKGQIYIVRKGTKASKVIF